MRHYEATAKELREALDALLVRALIREPCPRCGGSGFNPDEPFFGERWKKTRRREITPPEGSPTP